MQGSPYLDLRIIPFPIRPIRACLFLFRAISFIKKNGLKPRCTITYLSRREIPIGISPWDITYPISVEGIKIFTPPLIFLEDRRFHQHHGIDFHAIGRAIVANFRKFRIWQGGSTLTQQLVRNTLIFPSKSFLRKFCEWILSLSIERHFSKEEILQAYCNNVVMGPRVRGFAAAARIYHRVPENRLTSIEINALLGCLRTPMHTSPLVNSSSYIKRAKVVTKILSKSGVIENYTEPRVVPIHTRNFRKDRLSKIVDSILRQHYQSKLTIDSDIRRVHLTIDESTQSILDSVLLKVGKSEDVENIAAIVIDNKTGDILAESAFYNGEQSTFSPSFFGNLQAGSTFKPFALLCALEQGLSPDLALESSPVSVQFDKYAPPWEVRNYRHKYHGNISLREALAHSDNTVFARLFQLLDIDLLKAIYKEFGLATPKVVHPSLIIGATSPGISLIRLALAYAAIGNGGFLPQFHLIRGIEHYDGSLDTLSGHNLKKLRISQSAIQQLNSLLLETGIDLFGQKLGGKSGTTNKSNIYVAYDDKRSYATWVGFRRARPEWWSKGHMARSTLEKVLDFLANRDSLTIY
jgi:membrane peptidoglycan carboxypeptidase